MAKKQATAKKQIIGDEEFLSAEESPKLKIQEALKEISDDKSVDLEVSQEEATVAGEDFKSMRAKKFQMLSQTGVQNKASALQINLMNSESLRVAQDKILELEQELEKFRQDNEKLTSVSEMWQEKADKLSAKFQDVQDFRDQEKEDFSEEKRVLMTALDDVKKEVDRLKGQKKELEKRLSKDLQSIRVRENTLENRLEILKMESTVLQKEKTNKILDLQKKSKKLDDSLAKSHSKNQELQSYINDLKESSRKTVSVLRATIHNLEGYRSKETVSTILEDEEE